MPSTSNAKACGSHNGERSSEATNCSHGIAAVIEQAESLRSALREAYRGSNRLVIALKRHRKQARLMRSTIAALRQLAPMEQ
jgi:hypothetical protein